MCGFISGLSVLLQWSVFLFLCQYNTVSMTVALKIIPYCLNNCSLNSESLIFPPRFFFLKIALAVWGPFCIFIQILKIFVLVLWNATGNLIEVALNVDCFGYDSHFHNIDSSSPRTLCVSPPRHFTSSLISSISVLGFLYTGLLYP